MQNLISYLLKLFECIFANPINSERTFSLVFVFYTQQHIIGSWWLYCWEERRKYPKSVQDKSHNIHKYNSHHSPHTDDSHTTVAKILAATNSPDSHNSPHSHNKLKTVLTATTVPNISHNIRSSNNNHTIQWP